MEHVLPFSKWKDLHLDFVFDSIVNLITQLIRELVHELLCKDMNSRKLTVVVQLNLQISTFLARSTRDFANSDAFLLV